MYSIAEILPYVYQGVHKTSKKFYIGVRYGNVRIKKPINEDFGKTYKTSCKAVKPIFDEFDWQIVKIFSNPEDALAFESALIDQHWRDPLLINKNRGGKKFKRPNNYIRGPKREKKILQDRSTFYKEKWKNPKYRKSQIEKINASRTKRSKEWKTNHSKIMKKASQESKNVCRICRLSDRKEMTVQNFSRYPT
jgi:hypothetical protein